MSIVRMRKVFRSKLRVKAGKKQVTLASPAEIIFYLIIVIFLVGAYNYFGGPASRRTPEPTAAGRVTSVVAVVNGQKISRPLYDANIQMQQRGELGDVDLTQRRWIKLSTLNSLVDAFLTRQAARKEKIKVSSADIAKEKQDLIEQLLKQRFSDPTNPGDYDRRRLRDYLKKERQTFEQYKTQLGREEFKNPDALREQVAQKKLRELVESRVTVTDQELQDSFTEIKASHILIDPKKTAEKLKAAGQKNVTDQQADAAAKKKADELLQQVKTGADFAKLAKENSDDPGSAPKGGDLGWFKRGSVVKEFEDAAFKLQPGQVIVRIDRRYFRPAEVETLLGDATKARTILGWMPEVSFPELVAEMVREDFRTAQRDQLVQRHGHTIHLRNDG